MARVSRLMNKPYVADANTSEELGDMYEDMQDAVLNLDDEQDMYEEMEHMGRSQADEDTNYIDVDDTAEDDVEL
eukprot:m.30778 g.30778  ORF g.30778 m.30778 type:complete len:74 (-) comp12006_c0_seq21:2881-3102(-)